MKRTRFHISASITAKSTRPLIVEVMAVGKEAHIKINGPIFDWNENSAAEVSRKIAEVKANGITNAVVYLNTEGGSVFQANEINNLLEDNFDSVKIIAGALVASAGTYLLAKHPSEGKRNSLFMIHKPRGFFEGNEDEVVSQLEMLRIITSEYRTVYAERFGQTPEEIDTLWAAGDFWMSAAKAKEIGLINSIIDEEVDIDEPTATLISACGCPIALTVTKKPQKSHTKMELPTLAVSLGLTATATQAEVDAKLQEVKAKAKRADELEQAAQALLDNDIKSVLDEAERTKKITPKGRAFYEAMGKSNLEGLKAVLAEMPMSTAVSQTIDKSKPAGEDRSKWTFADYQEKAPEAFIEMLEKEPAKAKALADAHYKQ